MTTSARRRRPARPRPSRRSGRAHHISRGTRWVGQATERAPPSSRGEHFQEEITPARRARRKTEPRILGSCLSKVALLQRAAGPRGRPRVGHPMLRPDRTSYARQLQTASQEVATATQGHGRDLTGSVCLMPIRLFFAVWVPGTLVSSSRAARSATLDLLAGGLLRRNPHQHRQCLSIRLSL